MTDESSGAHLYGAPDNDDKQGTPAGGFRGERSIDVDVASGYVHPVPVDHGGTVMVEELSGVAFVEATQPPHPPAPSPKPTPTPTPDPSAPPRVEQALRPTQPPRTAPPGPPARTPAIAPIAAAAAGAALLGLWSLRALRRRREI